MLPTMFSNTKRNLIAGVTAAAVLVSGAAPAMAWGKNEQQFLAGVVTTLAVTALINNSPKYGNRAPVYYQPAPQPRHRYYRDAPQRPVYYAPAPVSIYGTPIGRTFNSYTSNERKRIQSTLTAYGYYHGQIDGAFGPGTYNSISAYARRTGKTAMLSTTGGSYGLLDGLLF